jgi:RHS repeat-associated protein
VGERALTERPGRRQAGQEKVRRQKAGRDRNHIFPVPGWELLSDEEAARNAGKNKTLRLLTKEPEDLSSGVMALKAAGIEAAGAINPGAFPIINELARSLEYDPKKIFDFVRNTIEFVPYYGVRQGFDSTVLRRAGSDAEQVLLMRELLNVSGYDAQIVMADVDYFDEAAMERWLGVTSSFTWPDMAKIFQRAGVPLTSYANGFSLRRFALVVSIDGQDCYFDPAFKQYTEKISLDLPNVIGYDYAPFVSGASAGASVSMEEVQYVHEGNIINNLQTYSQILIDYIQQNHPNTETDRLIGRGAVVPESLDAYQTTVPAGWNIISTGSDLPPELFATLQVQYWGINVTLQLQHVIGRRLTITFNAQNRPELRLDGVLVATGNGLTPGYGDYIDIAFDDAVSDPRTSYSFLICRSNNKYLIASDIGGKREKLIAYRQQLLGEYLSRGYSETSEAVIGETLHLMGLMYYQATESSARLMETATNSRIENIYNFGIVGQESSCFFDLPMSVTVVTNPSAAMEGSVFQALCILSSAFEHGVLEAMMGTHIPAISTVKYFQMANAQGDKVFRVNSANFGTISPQLINYSSYMINVVQSEMNYGSEVILPRNGLIQLNDWQGYSFLIRYSDGEIGMAISIGLNGGNGSLPATISGGTIYGAINAMLPKITQNPAIEKPVSDDPVDMVSGAFLYAKTDLALGGDISALAFNRSYNSDLATQKKSMGYGWTHNYDINLLRTSDMNAGLGGRNPAEAAAALAALYVTHDVYHQNSDLLAHMILMIGYKWMIDQILDNAVTIEAGTQLFKYIKFPDGSYSRPERQTADLVDNGDGTLSLVERFGTEMRFNSDDKIQQIIDNKGNEINFTYASGKLQTAADDFGHSVTLTYNGDNIATVSDSAGRSVIYHYDANGDMDYYIDANGKTWRFDYSYHKMTTLTNPLSIVTATNSYDIYGRVQTQTVPRQTGTATYNFYFSGYRNIEKDPYGKKTIYYIDHKGRTYAYENELGDKIVKEFDGQNHEVEVTDPRGFTTLLHYNGDQNLEKVTDPLLRETHFRYDTSLRLQEIEDALNHITTYEYYPDHLLKKITDPELNHAQWAYYPNGLLNTGTDARLTLTTMTYDQWGNPETSTTGSHPALVFDYDHIGRMKTLTDQEGATTEVQYDNSGKINKRIDPLNKEENFIYDDAGRFQVYTDRNNNTFTYDYTDSGKLEKVTYPDDSTVSFTYDLHDKLQTTTDAIGTTTYGYDDVYQITSVNDASGFDIGYDYDEAGNVIKITYPGYKEVIYGYDELNRLEIVTNWLNQVTTYHYDVAGRLDWVEHFNGTITNYDYDTADRLTDLENKTAVSGGETISRYSYILDGNGNREQSTQYEPLMPNPTNSTVAFGYNFQRNRLLNANNTSFSYDDEGQLLFKGTAGFEFDYDHRLKQISGAQTAQFFYDVSGNRLKAIRNGVETRCIYDLAGNLLAEADQTGTVTRYFIYGLGLLAMVTPDNQVYTYHYDCNGNTIAMTNEAKEVVNKYAYLPYGKIISQEELIEQPFTFAGMVGIMKEGDPANGGFYYMRARYYDPSIGRFISEDPSGFSDGPNLYAYVGGSPLMFVDPWGLCGENAWNKYLYEGVIPGPFGQPVSEWGDNGPTSWGDPIKYTEEAGGAWKWGERVAVGTAVVATGVAIAAGTGAIPNWSVGWKGGEITLTKPGAPTADWRFNPSKFHYHRRPGIGRHRPWEGGF